MSTTHGMQKKVKTQKNSVSDTRISSRIKYH